MAEFLDEFIEVYLSEPGADYTWAGPRSDVWAQVTAHLETRGGVRCHVIVTRVGDERFESQLPPDLPASEPMTVEQARQRW